MNAILSSPALTVQNRLGSKSAVKPTHYKGTYKLPKSASLIEFVPKKPKRQSRYATEKQKSPTAQADTTTKQKSKGNAYFAYRK